MIRPADAADVVAITSLEADCFGRTAWSAGLVADEVGGHTRTVLVDVDGEHLRAYGSVAIAGDVADLTRIAVDSAARRHGRARTLLDALVASAVTRGATRMLLEVADDNVAALALYGSTGFAVIARRRRYYADGTDSLVLERVLEEDR